MTPPPIRSAFREPIPSESWRIGGGVIWLVSASLFFLPFSKTLSEAGWVLAVLAWIFLQIKSKKLFSRPDALGCAYFLFLVCVLVSLMQAGPGMTPTAWRGVWKWFKYLAIFWMCRGLLAHPKNQKLVVFTLLLSMTLASLNGLWQMWNGVDLISGYSVDIPGRLIRMRGSFGSPNDLAAFYLIALPLAFQVWLNKKKWSYPSVSLAGMSALFFVGLILTLSRSALLALCTAVFIYLVVSRKKRALVIGALFLAMFLSFSGIARENFVTSLNTKNITVGERLRTWRQSWEIIKEKPLLGHGANTYYREFAAHAPADQEYRGYAHNFVLQIWSDLGLVGLSLFLFALFYGFLRQWPGKKTAPEFAALWVGLLAFVFQGSLDTNFFAFQTSHLFWVFWGILCSDGLISPSKKEAGNLA